MEGDNTEVKETIDQNLFTSKNIEDYKCSICTGIPYPNECVQMACCGNLFCSLCINQWLTSNNSCPICKKKIEDNDSDLLDVKTKVKFIYRQMRSLELLCPYKCDWKGTYGDLIDDHMSTCNNKKRKCKYHVFGCNFIESGEKLKIHQDNNDKMHLELAMKAAETGELKKKNKILLFDQWDEIKVDCHIHKLVYHNRHEGRFGCDGRHLHGGCPYGGDKDPERHIFSGNIMRYSCDKCKYDLCNYCAMKHAI